VDDRSVADRSRTMAAVRSHNTTPERSLRAALHRLGVRYRLGQVVETGGRRIRPDLVFKGARVALFVDGCFWHGCPDHCRRPGSNVDYWNAKIERNRARDARHEDALTVSGWTVVRVWEHEPPSEAAAALAALLDERRRRRTQP
jgi:DNA mismatch endonuclease (patch repair protein)